ncbi:MAG: NUDIX hydrolase [Porticoccaceae bacterium]
MPDKIHLTVATVVKRDNLFLMVKETEFGRSVINQPAGHVEPGEDIIDAAIRETYEETGWYVEIQNLIGIYSSKAKISGITYYRLAFLATALSHDPDATIDADIEEVIWLSEAEINKSADMLRSELVLKCIKDFNNGAVFPLDIFRNRL